LNRALRPQFGWREAVLALLVFAPLACLFLFFGPVPQDQSFHALADRRAWLGVPNFADVASNLAFLAAGLAGLRSARHAGGARSSWMVFFLGVALVFFGSGYYHLSPGDETVTWDRLPMTVAFMGLFAGLLAEHLPQRIERPLLAAALAVGIASVLLWRQTGDLRVYLWVQGMPLLAIPFVMALYPARYTHRHYLIYGVALYALAKAVEFADHGIFAATSEVVSGHTLKHLVAAGAPLCVYLMLRRRSRTG
jgi:hypothetical protein